MHKKKAEQQGEQSSMAIASVSFINPVPRPANFLRTIDCALPG